MANEVAEPDELFVCLMCGKTSKDRYGKQAISPGWDEACMVNAQKFKKSRLEIVGTRVIEVREEEM